MHLGQGIAGVITLAFALAMLVWGWQLFRIVVAIGGGILSGSVLGLIVAFVVGSQGKGFDGLQQAGAAGIVGFLFGFVIGVVVVAQYQQVGAALVAGLGTGGIVLGGLALWIKSSDAPEGLLTVSSFFALVIGGLAVILVIKAYDYFAAACTALMVASMFNTFAGGGGFFERLLKGDIERAFTVLFGNIGSAIWSHLLVTTWIVIAAVMIRQRAWYQKPGTALTPTWTLRPQWLRAILAASGIVLWGTFVEKTLGWGPGTVAGVLPVLWPALVMGLVHWLPRLAASEGDAPPLMANLPPRALHFRYLAAGAIALPLVSVVVSAVAADLPRFGMGVTENLASTGLLSSYFGGFFLASLVTDSPGGFDYLAAPVAKWATAVVAVPMAVEWARRGPLVTDAATIAAGRRVPVKRVRGAAAAAAAAPHVPDGTLRFDDMIGVARGKLQRQPLLAWMLGVIAAGVVAFFVGRMLRGGQGLPPPQVFAISVLRLLLMGACIAGAFYVGKRRAHVILPIAVAGGVVVHAVREFLRGGFTFDHVPPVSTLAFWGTLIADDTWPLSVCAAALILCKDRKAAWIETTGVVLVADLVQTVLGFGFMKLFGYYLAGGVLISGMIIPVLEAGAFALVYRLVSTMSAPAAEKREAQEHAPAVPATATEESAPAEPAPTEPAPTEPQAAAAVEVQEPAPVQPARTEPMPVEPVPQEPPREATAPMPMPPPAPAPAPVRPESTVPMPLPSSPVALPEDAPAARSRGAEAVPRTPVVPWIIGGILCTLIIVGTAIVVVHELKKPEAESSTERGSAPGDAKGSSPSQAARTAASPVNAAAAPTTAAAAAAPVVPTTAAPAETAAAAAETRPEGFPEEVPRKRTRPPNVKEWAEAPTVKMEPEGCFRKVVREWLKLNCSKSESNNPGAQSFSNLEAYGAVNADYFEWTRPGQVADVIVRMVPGRRGVATLQLESRSLQVGYDWSSSGAYPAIVWE